MVKRITQICKKLPLRFLILGMLFLNCLLLPFILSAQGDLFVYPKRVVFEKAKRYQEINLANTGNDIARYSISVLQMKMKEDGGFEIMDGPEPGHNFAHENFRFFPRNVVLGPNESQVLKIQIINVKNLEPGEYRSHLYFRSEPERKPLGDSIAVNDTTAMTIELTPIYGITIPIIIQKGMVDAQVKLSDYSIGTAQDGPVLNLTLNRLGNISVYGDVLVEYIGGKSKKAVAVGRINGLAVYTPNALRKIQLRLDIKEGVDFTKGVLRITYTGGSRQYFRELIKL